jgi:hypothetical protein
MQVEWQGDYKLLDPSGEREAFARELKRVGYADTASFIVVVRREPDSAGAIRYKVHVTEIGRDRETLTLDGGGGRDWIAEFARQARGHSR